MELTCANCYHIFNGTISLDNLGWHSVCPECGSSFDVDIPKGRIKMFFMDTASGATEDFDDYYRSAAVCNFYAFDSVKDFIAKWKEISKDPDSMWYWCYDGEIEDCNCFYSGACDSSDIDIFREHFFFDEQNRMKIDFGFTKLVAERCDDGEHVGFVLGMYDAQGDWQDICYVEAKPKDFKDSRYLRCFVWGDSNSENYTNEFVIDQHKN